MLRKKQQKEKLYKINFTKWRKIIGKDNQTKKKKKYNNESKDNHM